MYQQNQNMNAMNNALPPGLEKGMSAFDDDDDCELGSDIDGDEQNNPQSALKNQASDNQMKSLYGVNVGQAEEEKKNANDLFGLNAAGNNMGNNQQ